MGNDITAVSTTDSQAQVEAALAPRGTPAPAETPAAAPETAKPAETPAEPAKPTETAPAAPAATDDADDDAGSKAGKALNERKSRLQARIDELTFDKHNTAAERDRAVAKADELQRQLDALKAGKPAPAAEPEAPAAPEKFTKKAFDEPKPKQEDFDDYDKFSDAKDDWTERRARHNFQQELDEKAHNERVARDEAEMRTRVEAAQRAYTERFNAAKTKYPDFEQKMKDGANMPLSEAQIQHMRLSEQGVDLLYFFLNNPAEAERIGALPDGRAMAEMGKIEARLEAAATPAPATETPAPAARATVSTTTPPQPKPAISRAPAPVATVQSSVSSGQVTGDQLSWEDWKAQRNAQVQARREGRG